MTPIYYEFEQEVFKEGDRYFGFTVRDTLEDDGMNQMNVSKLTELADIEPDAKFTAWFKAKTEEPSTLFSYKQFFAVFEGKERMYIVEVLRGINAHHAWNATGVPLPNKGPFETLDDAENSFVDWAEFTYWPAVEEWRTAQADAC